MTAELIDTIVRCTECNCVIPDRDSATYITYGGRSHCMCESCTSDNLTSCEDCGCLYPNDDIVTLNYNRRNESLICKQCAEENYYKCSDCGQYISEEYLSYNDGNTFICCDCDDNWAECSDCGRIFNVYDEGHYNENTDAYYCDNCSVNHNDELHDYYYKPYDNEDGFLEMDGETDVKLHFGIEQETDSGHNRGEYVDKLYDISDNEKLFVMKEDGSLTNGVEIVSWPCSFEYFMKKYPFEDIQRIANDYNYVSHDSGNCGLHIHVSYEGLGENEKEQDLTVAKLMILFDLHWDNIVKFSRRKNMSWCHKPDANILEQDTPETAINKSLKNHWEHSMAINLQHDNTVEFRVFRGSLNPNTVKASIQFVKVIVDWAMKHSLRECQHVSWIDLVSSDYTELNNYLVERGLDH